MFQVTVFVALFCVASAFNAPLGREAVLKPFVDGNALKIISGLKNFNSKLVKDVVIAAQNGGASHVDIACDPDLVAMAKSCTSLPVCVSSVRPIDFVAAVEAGADMIEIGNFDSFYADGIVFTSEDVIKLTQETRDLLPNVPLSVTIPHTLSLEAQISLAKRVEACGADVIQTEGKMSSNVGGMGVQELIEVAAPTLASAFALSRAVSIPVMCASGLTDVTAPLALAAGARGVGVGSMVNKLPSQHQMILAVSAIASSIRRNIDNNNKDAAVESITQPRVSARVNVNSRASAC